MREFQKKLAVTSRSSGCFLTKIFSRRGKKKKITKIQNNKKYKVCTSKFSNNIFWNINRKRDILCLLFPPFSYV